MFCPNMFVDAAWKEQVNVQPAKAGAGIYITWKNQLHTTDIFISARTSLVSTPLQAEAEVLLIAANIASSLLLQEPIFFIDNLNLAKAAEASGAMNPTVLWEIRRQAIQFQEITQQLHPRIVHLNRSLNVLAHNCAHQANTLSITLPIYFCRNATHSNSNCSLAGAINWLHLPGTIFLSVQFL
jgi:hypothetical protein